MPSSHDVDMPSPEDELPAPSSLAPPLNAQTVSVNNQAPVKTQPSVENNAFSFRNNSSASLKNQAPALKRHCVFPNDRRAASEQSSSARRGDPPPFAAEFPFLYTAKQPPKQPQRDIQAEVIDLIDPVTFPHLAKFFKTLKPGELMGDDTSLHVLDAARKLTRDPSFAGADAWLRLNEYMARKLNRRIALQGGELKKASAQLDKANEARRHLFGAYDILRKAHEDLARTHNAATSTIANPPNPGPNSGSNPTTTTPPSALLPTYTHTVADSGPGFYVWRQHIINYWETHPQEFEAGRDDNNDMTERRKIMFAAGLLRGPAAAVLGSHVLFAEFLKHPREPETWVWRDAGSLWLGFSRLLI
ncbi:hypothetical protein N0V88_001052 [Collariella sp. IMI 366227]|nr:hypothetical protein N0V88_001052 [Collariella sp. IMI 366227]